MSYKNKDRKAKISSNKILLTSVTKELAQPRMTESAQIKTDKRIEPRDRKG
jgi:hypothetical protein